VIHSHIKATPGFRVEESIETKFFHLREAEAAFSVSATARPKIRSLAGGGHDSMQGCVGHLPCFS
jgi:hypothetical protein